MPFYTALYTLDDIVYISDDVGHRDQCKSWAFVQILMDN